MVEIQSLVIALLGGFCSFLLWVMFFANPVDETRKNTAGNGSYQTNDGDIRVVDDASIADSSDASQVEMPMPVANARLKQSKFRFCSPTVTDHNRTDCM